MIKELNYQREAVDELARKTIKLLDESGNRKKLVFKAPTGAGKTVMSSQLLDELVTQFAELGREAAFIWIAPNKLHQQSYMKMRNFFSETRVLRPVMYDELDHSVNGYIHPSEVFFVNWESINKDKNVMVRESENSASLYDITRRTKEEHGLPIIVIIDEEHMFGGKLAKQSEKVLKNIEPKVEIRISATPITSPDELVSISRDQVIREEMIKDGITINPLLAEIPIGVGENEYMLEVALQKREELRQAYEKLGVRINPLLLIQLPNDNSEVVDEAERTIIEMVKTRLESMHEITTANGKLAIWLSGEKVNLDGIENDYNLTEALLFKQAIALGWDCPRAAVLLIYRNISSETFGVQTVGRIMRMPEQKYYPDPILNHGWVYTNLSRDKIEIVAEDMNYISKSLVSYRRESLQNVSLPSVYSERLSADRNRLGSDFYPVLVEMFNSNWFKHPVQYMLFDDSPFDDEATKKDNYDPRFMKDYEHNRKMATLYGGIDFCNHGVQVQLISDVEVTGDAGVTDVDESKQVKYAKNQTELMAMFNKFCEKRLLGFEKISVTSLRGYILQLMEDYLGIFETDTPRTILYYKNRPKFADVIDKAVAKYVKKIGIRRDRAKSRSFREYTWEVPETREYNESANDVVSEVKQHAMLPFIRQKQVSMPERRFEVFLEANKESIDWWYKNGDEGKQHYAISYEATGGAKTLFYVDFVIRMKNGQIFLFDTKSQQSDLEAPNKHNALLDYIESERNRSLHLLGGVLIEVKENWYWSPMRIENTADPIGDNWLPFQPDNYNS